MHDVHFMQFLSHSSPPHVVLLCNNVTFLTSCQLGSQSTLISLSVGLNVPYFWLILYYSPVQYVMLHGLDSASWVSCLQNYRRKLWRKHTHARTHTPIPTQAPTGSFGNKKWAMPCNLRNSFYINSIDEGQKLCIILPRRPKFLTWQFAVFFGG